MRMLQGERTTAQFDLTLTVNDLNTGFDFVFEYNTDLFKKRDYCKDGRTLPEYPSCRY
jgi:hypothetical protein